MIVVISLVNNTSMLTKLTLVACLGDATPFTECFFAVDKDGEGLEKHVDLGDVWGGVTAVLAASSSCSYRAGVSLRLLSIDQRAMVDFDRMRCITSAQSLA
jgi:hypothetical protein